MSHGKLLVPMRSYEKVRLYVNSSASSFTNSIHHLHQYSSSCSTRTVESSKVPKPMHSHHHCRICNHVYSHIHKKTRSKTARINPFRTNASNHNIHRTFHKKHRHPTFPRPKNPQSAKPASNIIASRIEKKKPTTHRNRKPASATASKLLIRVFIINRLGSRKEILSSPSATIGAFEDVAATHLGTRPEAILLKRQSERPFKDDGLTLENYEISGGSSLGFEIDTGGS